MRAVFLSTAILGLALAIAVPASELSEHAKAFQTATSAGLVLTVTPIGGNPDQYTVTLGRDSSFRFETNSTLTVSDGKMLWTLDKAANTYTESPTDAQTLPAFLKKSLPWAYTAFYDKTWEQGIVAVKPGRERKVSGVDVRELAVTKKATPADITMTLMVDVKTNLVRGMVVPATTPGGAETIIFAKTLELNQAVPANAFAFTAPEGAKKYEKPAVAAVSYSEVQAIFTRSCVSCHGPNLQRDGVRLDSYASVMASNVVSAGNSAGSRVVRVMNGNGRLMPPTGMLPEESRKKVADWIDGGAKNE